MRLRNSLISLISAGFLGIAAVALAHTGATGVVKERMDGMGAMGKALKSMSQMVRGDLAYDADTMAGYARAIEAHSGEAMLTLFPEGSLDHPTEAKPEIWSDWARFSELSMELKEVAHSLVVAAPEGVSDAALKEITGLCAACHDDFRVEK